jgi:hypothetical protein
MNEKEEKQAEEASRKYAEKRKGIIECFPKKGIGAEIGVLYCHFSKHILEIAKPKLLYLADPWMHDPRQEVRESNCGRRSQEQMNEMHDDVMREYYNSHYYNVTIHRGKSAEFFEIIAKQFFIKFDFVYIDGDHTFMYVLLDLCLSWGNMNPGGIIAGDDYGVVGWWNNGVTEAVDLFCENGGIKPEIIGNQFLIRRI